VQKKNVEISAEKTLFENFPDSEISSFWMENSSFELIFLCTYIPAYYIDNQRFP